MPDPIGIEERLTERYGLKPRAGWQPLIEKILAHLSEERGLTCERLVSRLDHEPGLLRQVAGALTVSETYFFRHPAQYEYLAWHIEGLLRCCPPNELLRIWSAGCSSGEELYSLAIRLHERLPRQSLARIELCGSDINAVAIERARRAHYSRWAFQQLRPEALGRFFEQGEQGRLELREEIRQLASFEVAAVQEHLALLPPRHLDVVLFRNVAVYLSSRAVAQIYGDMARVLKPTGRLLTAPTDPRPPRDRLQTVEIARLFVYRPKG